MDTKGTTTDRDRDARRRRLGLLGLLTLSGLLSIGGGSSTLAIFTDSDGAAASFSTGTIDLEAAPATVFSVSGMFPGDSGSQTLTVSNAGTGALRYAMSTTAVDPDGLAAQLDLTITAGTCPGAGGALYGAAAMDVAALGNPIQGAHSGDRTLAAASSEDLCFAWSLPDTTGNAFQGTSTSVTFTFDAEQTANNP